MSGHSRDDHPRDSEDETTRLDPDGRDSSESEGADASLKLPGYQVIRKLGSGGMGQVFLARQTEPVDREVAIKLILRRIQSPTTEVRFLVERQALAQMHHPAIAQIYDAGTNPVGYPYFAMEYVRGLPLMEFCTENRLDLNQRLELFTRICRGVSHAHQKGIIHRDLKPANILVSMIDDIPSPKIIDFGIATAASAGRQRQSESSAGTPLYMSPELFDENSSIDIRSDVYSLGIILYELLTDRHPHDRSLFKGRDTAAIRRQLTRGSPPEPSVLFERAGEACARIARSRRETARGLKRRLKGDLDAIAMMAVDPDRDSRYAGVLELAEDVDAYLARKPVRAMGDARGYRLRRFLTRHAVAVAGASLVVLSLIIGLTMAVVGMTEAQRQQRIAEERSEELERMIDFQQSMLGDMEPRVLGEGFVERLRRQYAQSFGPRADGETIRAGVEAFEVAVGQINPTDLAQDLIDEFMMQRALDSIENDFSEDPQLQAELYETVRDVYNSAGMIESSLPLAERIVELRLDALGPDATATLEARQELYRLRLQNGDYDAARAQLDEILERMDPQDPGQLDLRHNTWDSEANLLVDTGHSERALEVARENLERAENELGMHHEHTVRALNTLGYVHALSGDLESALEWFRKSLERARGHFDETENAYYSAMLNVSAALSGLDRYEEALEVGNEVYEILSNHFGHRNPSTIRVMNNNAVTLMDLGRHDEATELLAEIFRLGRETYGHHNPTTLRLQINLGDAYLRTGDPQAALEQFREVARWRERLKSADHPDTLSAHEYSVRAHLALGQFDAALELAEFIHDRRAERLEPDAAELEDARRRVADIHQQAGNDRAEARWRQMMLDARIDSERHGEPQTLREAVRLFELRKALDEQAQADELAELIERELARGGSDLDEIRADYSALAGQ